MKTATQFFPMMMALLLISIAGNVMAQERGRHNSNKHHRADDYETKDHHHDNDRKHHWKHDRQRDHNFRHGHRTGHHHHDGRQVRHVAHHHDRYCDHHHAATHNHQRPRYVHYRDYDVYYDLHRDEYIAWSGRTWTVTSSLPVVLHRVDVRRTVRMEVDYVDDDFPTFLQTRRPAYRRVYLEY